jgi:hypothetical protein
MPSRGIRSTLTIANAALAALPLAIAILLAAPATGTTKDLPQGTAILDPDLVWDLEPDVVLERHDPAFAISPDDKQIAYISKGAIWKCAVSGGPPTLLADLPNTKTACLARPEYRDAWNKVSASGIGLDRQTFLGKLPKELIGVFGLEWSPTQDGVFFTLGEGTQVRPWTVTYPVMHASNAGVVSPVTTIQRDAYDEPHRLNLFNVTRDRKHVVASSGYAPLIWVAAANKPRATCFDLLAPSPASGRFLGIEIDTRQLVIADEDFKVSQRFDATFIPQRACALTWSPDERYAICQTREEHPSEKWHGFRIDLQTGEKRGLEGAHFPDRWYFTGQMGEAIRIGKTLDLLGVYADGGGCGSYISILPDGHAQQRDVARFKRPGESHYEYAQKAGLYPPVRAAPDCQLFAIAFPREDAAPGYLYELVDRNGNKWSLGPNDQTQRISPFYVIAIANHGQTIVACDDTRLFSIPVEVVKNAKHASHE